MKKKEILEDLEIYVDPKPLTEDESIALSLFIRQLKSKKAQRPTAPTSNCRERGHRKAS
jgi:hypothetical protein